MSRWIERATKRRGAVIGFWVVALMLLAGASFAAVGAKNSSPKSQTPKVEANETESPDAEASDAPGVHGGPQPRIHDGCTAATGLTGNWTHGDYVSAVASANPGDSQKISDAAKSDCGKVDHSKQTHGKSGEDHGQSGDPHGKSGDHKPASTPAS